MSHLKEPITEYTFTDLLNWNGKEKIRLDDEDWLDFLQDIFFIGTEERGLVQIYCLPDLEI